MKFSERMGFVEVDDTIQLDKMNQKLKNDIFNFWRNELERLYVNRAYHPTTQLKLNELLWTNYFHETKPVNYVPTSDITTRYDKMKFYEVYDFLEFLMQTLLDNEADIRSINQILESNHSGYRFVKNQLEPISSDTDITTIKNGLEAQIDNGHLQNALNELGKRADINLNTIMKESIDAVETATHHITTKFFNGQPKDTMGRSIAILKDNGFIENHPAYLAAFSNLYGYSSDGGIRHPKDRDYKVDQAEATFMLEICSAFISMLKFKLAEYQTTNK
ncbi:hypothetical protein J8401_012865 [Lactiplantibacillus plantarum]|uniref:AbiJ-NTD4 domain-containing protein n=1 Tax=Lactiplantibacillus plantarum TaxID=1590 RepID=UPI001BCFA084|nr:hypothetical protein [Lactiplantibacillus plantarum]MBY7658426.1 hypothetical protein [Lactiplantibacillus plantarum]